MDASPEESLIGVDVPHPRNPALVEQQRLDGSPPSFHQTPQVGSREQLIEGLKTQPGREEGIHRLRPEQQLPGAEASRIDEGQAARCAAARRRPEQDTDTGMRGLGVWVGEHRSRHPQVLGQEDLIREGPQQVLAPARKPLDATPLQSGRQLLGGERTRPAGIEYLDPAQPAALHEGGKLASDRLDLW